MPWQQIESVRSGPERADPKRIGVGSAAAPPTAAQPGDPSPGWNARRARKFTTTAPATFMVFAGKLCGGRSAPFDLRLAWHGVYARGSLRRRASRRSPKITWSHADRHRDRIQMERRSCRRRMSTEIVSVHDLIGMVCAADPPSSWATGAPLTAQTTMGIGLNISEPLPAPANAGASSVYYPQPVAANPSIAPANSVYDAYDDLTQTTHRPRGKRVP